MSGEKKERKQPIGFIVLYGKKQGVESEVVWNGGPQQVEPARNELTRVIREVLVEEDY